MSGKPAARQGDMTRKGLDIVQGSAGVLISFSSGKLFMIRVLCFTSYGD